MGQDEKGNAMSQISPSYVTGLEKYINELRNQVSSLKAELREICAAIDDPASDLTLTTVECIKKLKAENESLRKDAERYRWIPVTEKLPDPEEPVLVARDGRYYAEKTCHTGKEWLLESNHYLVTHWRVFPITPQAKADFESMIDGQKRLSAMKGEQG